MVSLRTSGIGLARAAAKTFSSGSSRTTATQTIGVTTDMKVNRAWTSLSAKQSLASPGASGSFQRSSALALATGLFLRRAGPSASTLDGAYVRNASGSNTDAFPSMRHRRVRVRVCHRGRGGHHLSDARGHVRSHGLDRDTHCVFLSARHAADRFSFTGRGRPILRRRALPITPAALARVRRGDPRPHNGSREARNRRRRVQEENTKVRAVGGRVAAPCAGPPPA